MIKKKIKMDLSINNAPQVVYAVQGDTNTRNVVIDLYNAGAAWTVPDGASGVVKFQKADGKGGIYDKLPNGFPAVVYEENSNQIEVSLAPQVLTFPGEVKAQVSLIYDNNIISTFSFVVLVQEDPSANTKKSTDYVNWDRYFIPQTSGASVGQYLKITKVDDLGRVIEVSPVDAPSGSGAIDGELDMKSNSILNVGTVEFWNDDELATVIIQSEFPEGDNESEDFNGVIEFRTSRGDEPVVIRNVADAKNPNEAVNRKQLDESMDHKKLSNRDAADQHPIEAITGLREILDEVAGSGGNANHGGISAVLSSWHGKKWYVLGDSISAEASLSYGHTDKLYHAYIKEYFGFSEVVNLAESGATVAENSQSPKSIVAQLREVSDDADLITIYAGVNDRWFNTPMGQPDDVVDTTFYGAMNGLCESLHENHSGATVLFITPTEQNNASCNAANTTGKNVRDLAKAMIEVCEKYAIDYYDANKRSGIYPQIASNGDMYTSDGLHLSHNGHKRLADNFAAFLVGRGDINYVVPAKSITLVPTAMEFSTLTGYKTLDVSISPADATEIVKCHSTNPSVATINHYRAVFPKGDGECDIIVSCGDISATCHVVVDSGNGGGEPEVTLISISATYSGGDVAVGTPVNAISGVSVTAHYSDGNTAPVTDFTLSGEIGEGENIITVSYAGLTTTIAVIGIDNTPVNVLDRVIGKKWTITKEKWEGEFHIAAMLDGYNISNGDNMECTVTLSDVENCAYGTSVNVYAAYMSDHSTIHGGKVNASHCFMPQNDISESEGESIAHATQNIYNYTDGKNLVISVRIETTAVPASFRLNGFVVTINGEPATIIDFDSFIAGEEYTLE